MALPQNIEDLLAPSDVPPLTEDWHHQFAPYRWCRLVSRKGRSEVLRGPLGRNGQVRPLLQKDGMNMLKAADIRLAATGHVPDAWKQHEDFADLNWDTPLGESQIVAAIRGEAIPFDRACLVIAAVDLLFMATGHERKSVRDHFRLAPAIFRLNQFNNTFFEKHFTGAENRTRFHDLRRFTGNSKTEFFEDIAAGRGATYSTLLTIDETLRKKFGIDFRGDIVAYPQRTHSTRAARFENPIFPKD